MPEWSQRLCNLYWWVRCYRGRNPAGVRRYYRLIVAEKQRLEKKNIDPEEIRLSGLYNGSILELPFDHSSLGLN